MNPTGTRLAQAQVKGHLALDQIYAQLADAVEAEVLRWGVPDQDPADDASRLPVAARSAILVAVGRLIDGQRLRLTDAVLAARQHAIVAAQHGHAPLPPDAIATVLARHEVYRTLGTDRASVIGQTSAILLAGIARDLTAREIARRVRQYFSPWFAPRRNAQGQVVRGGRQGAIASWPGRAGMASQHPRLVLLYQTTSAHGTTVQRIAARDRLNVRWNVSYQHQETDVCDGHAKRDVGLGPGVYPWDDAPTVPQHVNCRCYYSTVEPNEGVVAA